jgi:site-specific DNA-methyltransferase (adenine-specific)
MGNHLYYGDNLKVLRESIKDSSVDLIYLDPPFNSNASYNVLFKGPQGNDSTAQIEAFDDTWQWGEEAETAFAEVLRSPNGAAAEMLRAMRAFLGENAMMAYLAMMAVRMLELHRVLKPTGSLYLHCDPTASHYLKILLDAVFGARNFRNEIIWRRTGAHNSAKRFGPIHDVILFYSKSDQYRHRSVFTPYLRGHVDMFFKKRDKRGHYWTNSLHGAGTRNGDSGRVWRGYDPTAAGRHWAIPKDLVLSFGIDPELPQHEKLDALYELGLIDLPETGLPTYRQYLESSPGQLLQDIWAFQPHTKGCLYGTEQGIDEDVRWIPPRDKTERLGYPTQKPVALLERILNASSNPGDVVLDPFCGCGTTVHAAQKLGREWIGIDVTHLAIGLIEKRLRDAFADVAFTTHGVPTDLGGAQALAEADKHEFEKWALSLIDATPGNQGKKGADGGFDGNRYFGKSNRAIVSVKGGRNVGVSMIRDLDSVVARLKADVGILLTLVPPTKPMQAEAAAAGQFELDGFNPVPRLQVVTIEEALKLRDRAVRLPAIRADMFRKAAREEDGGRQASLDL